MKKKKYLHIEVVQTMGKGDNHEHIHRFDKVIRTDKTAREIIEEFHIEVYECDVHGVGLPHSETEVLIKI